jgi:uncharacterized membrane protein required for colicin V production
MLIDFSILLVVVLLIMLGYKQGFIHTLIHMLGWVISVIVAIIFAGNLANFLGKHFSFGDVIERKVATFITSIFKNADSLISKLPSFAEDAAKEALDNTINTATDKVTQTSMIAIAFVIIFVVLKIALFFIEHVLSKKYNHGFVGVFDGFGGAIIGVARATVIIFILLFLLHPAALFFGGADASAWVDKSLDQSIFSWYLYEKNPISALIGGYEQELFTTEYWTAPLKDTIPGLSSPTL